MSNDNFPKHVGIIMDGNGRWAKKRGLPRTMGHTQGAKTFKQTVDDCRDLGIEYVTFYAFSTENWKRPKKEVDALMGLLKKYLVDIKGMARKNTRIIFLGDKSRFEEKIRALLEETEGISAANTGMTLMIALNYGGRDEILYAAKKIAEEYKSGLIEDLSSLSEDDFADHLYTKGIPPLDLVIRPSGEQRLSNFLIWQAAYAEFVFMDVLWPDFSKSDLESALGEFANRSRRYGGV